MSGSAGPSLSFTAQDLAAFSEASGDRNPLHLNREYAQRTPFGQPVVFGCLGAMACLGQIRLPAGWRAASVEAHFLRPMFSSVEYRVETFCREGIWGARLFDGRSPAVSVRVTAERFERDETTESPGASAFDRREAAVRRAEEIVTGLAVSGVYACDASALSAVMTRWGVSDRLLATVLCWSSYLVGMELPGESALFFKLVLNLVPGLLPDEMTYQASVASVDSKFGQIKADVSLIGGGSVVASGQCWSILRPSALDVEEVDSSLVRRDSLAGRAAVLVGSSRGLGAAIKRAIELRGAAVYGMSRSESGGDAGDPAALRRLRERVVNEQDRLDFLVCNACPPILSLRLEPNAAARIAEYINLAVSLTLAPLCEFLELLNRSDGCVVIVSSAAVEHPVREWPHYVAAKQAVEALGNVAALQYPRVRVLIVRPQKLLTAMTNTPMGRLGASSPGLLADRIAARLEGPLEPGVQVLK